MDEGLRGEAVSLTDADKAVLSKMVDEEVDDAIRESMRKAILDQKVEREYRDWRDEKAGREAADGPVTIHAEVRKDGRIIPILGPGEFTLRSGDTLVIDLQPSYTLGSPPTYVGLYADEPPDQPSVSADGYARKSLDFTRVVVPMCFFYPPVIRPPSLLQRFFAFMDNFWWNTACPCPDGRFGWLRYRLYNWTAALHAPWYLLQHPERLGRFSFLPWLVVRGVLSIVLLPFGLAIWLAEGRRMRFFPRKPNEPDATFPSTSK
jgi:hypothetical protein